ncbi:hypothetical protein IFM89_022201 [Coptis chinensis]|uniref:F-box domain-containing protein n=1 Tax=Coptis chinensis TaxID=261450 RepID=A0A835HXL9_9MAGN|nr:hypothetical protein IFM89_022201 [Coptis chinensis]
MTSTKQTIDRLSSMPEEIRDCILSFLPMEDVVRTCILSRKWRDICSSLSHLEFNCPDFRSARYFKNFVDCFLITHGRFEIRSFKLVMDDTVDIDVINDVHVNAWIYFAIKHNVRVMELSFPWELFPDSVFMCHTLTELRLEYVEIHLPRTVSFPCLKILKLTENLLYGEKLTENIFSSCLMLEELIIRSCSWHDFSIIISSPPNLKVLELREKEDGNVASRIRICSPNLEELKYFGPTIPRIDEVIYSSLVTLDFESCERPCFEPDYSVAELLKGLRNVAKLSLDSYCFEVLGQDPNLEACLPTSCCSLRHLRLVLRPFKDYVKVLILVLRSYPNLETLHISFKTKLYLKSILVSSEQAKVLFNAYFLKHLTGHLLKHLKTIKIENFRVADENELHIVRYLLENAISLKKMSIVHHLSIKEDVKLRLLVAESLLTFTKVSPDAVIVFS